MTTISAQVDDDLFDQLSEVENKSQTVRQALRDHFSMFGGMPEYRTAAYRRLLEITDRGDRVLAVSVAKSVVAQEISVGADHLESVVFDPLVDAGYLDIGYTIDQAYIVVNPPEEVDSDV